MRPEPWRWGHPRVLIEHPDEATGLAIASELRFAGYAVTICTGPHRRGQCPLAGPAGCAPAHDADLVVCCLGYERDAAREVLQALRTQYPDMALLVEAPADVAADLGEQLDGCHMLPAPVTATQIAVAVARLLGPAGTRSPEDA